MVSFLKIISRISRISQILRRNIWVVELGLYSNFIKYLILFLLHFCFFCLYAKQERSVSQENAIVALWDLISKHAAVILPLCTADQQFQIAHLIIRTITQETQDARQIQQGYVTK